MSRPTGANWNGERWSLDDSYAMIAGTASRYDSVGAEFDASSPISSTIARAANPAVSHDNDFCRAFAGFEGVWYGGAWQTYLNTGDFFLVVFEWVLRVKGTGQIKVRDQIDNGFLQVRPSNLVATVNLALTDWQDVVVPTVTFGIDEAADTANYFELGVEVVSGTIDIDVVNFQMRSFIPNPIGAEVLQVGESTSQNPIVDEVHVSRADDPSTATTYATPTYMAYDDAWDDMQTVIHDDMSEKTTFTGENFGWGSGRAEAGADYDNTGLVGPWRFQYVLTYLSITVALNEIEPFGYLSGVEGADYARYPDRGYRDWDAYWRWSGTARPSIVGWTNDTIFVSTNRRGPDTPDSVGFQIVTGGSPGAPYDWAPSRIIVPPTIAGTTYTVPEGPTPTDHTVTGSLPYEGSFYIIFSNEVTNVQPPEFTDGSPVVGLGAALVIVLQLASESDPLEADIDIPAYHYYNPNASPTTGVLKVYGEDLTWHTLGIGNPGRIRVYTEDLTWWEEKRTGETGSQSIYLQTPWDWVYELPFRPMP